MAFFFNSSIGVWFPSLFKRMESLLVSKLLLYYSRQFENQFPKKLLLLPKLPAATISRMEPVEKYCTRWKFCGCGGDFDFAFLHVLKIENHFLVKQFTNFSFHQFHLQIGINQSIYLCPLFVRRSAGMSSFCIFEIINLVTKLIHFCHHFSCMSRVNTVVSG